MRVLACQILYDCLAMPGRLDGNGFQLRSSDRRGGLNALINSSKTEYERVKGCHQSRLAQVRLVNSLAAMIANTHYQTGVASSNGRSTAKKGRQNPHRCRILRRLALHLPHDVIPLAKKCEPILKNGFLIVR